MKRAILVAALICAGAPPDTVQAQDRGGAAGVAALRGDTASAGVWAAGPAAAPAAMPVDVQAAAPARPTAGLAGDVARGRRATAVRPGCDRGRRRPRHA